MTERSRTSTIARLASVAVVAGLAALASPSQARMTHPEVNSLGAACWQMQQKGDRLIAEYKNATNERREAILQELRNNGRDWRAAGCQAAYGDISKLVLTPGGLRNGITWDMMAQGSAATSDGGSSGADTGAAGGGGGGMSDGGGGGIFLY